MTARIIDRGRGPEIEGTRITLYDVVDYWKQGWRYDQIAGLFRLPPDDVQAAVHYIEEHQDQVIADYDRILRRHRDYRYPPEVEEKRRNSREKLQIKLNELKARRSAETGYAGDHGRPYRRRPSRIPAEDHYYGALALSVAANSCLTWTTIAAQAHSICRDSGKRNLIPQPVFFHFFQHVPVPIPSFLTGACSGPRFSLKTNSASILAEQGTPAPGHCAKTEAEIVFRSSSCR